MEQTYGRYLAGRHASLKRKLLNSLREHWRQAEPKIRRAEMVMAFAEQILRNDKADGHIAIPACLLHDVGSTAARQFLLRAGLRLEDIEEVCRLIGANRADGSAVEHSANFRVAHDAGCLAELEEQAMKPSQRASWKELEGFSEAILLTQNGRRLARERYSIIA